jgi:hypothetical protein
MDALALEEKVVISRPLEVGAFIDLAPVVAI